MLACAFYIFVHYYNLSYKPSSSKQQHKNQSLRFLGKLERSSMRFRFSYTSKR